MDPAFADRGMRMAVRWWRDLLIHRHEESISAHLFTSVAERTSIRPERASAFQAALVTEIQATFGREHVIGEVAVPASGADRRKLEVIGMKAPTEAVRAADSAGLSHVLRHLTEGAMTAIHPGLVVSHAGSSAVRETSDFAARQKGGSS